MKLTSITKARLYTFALTLLVMLALMLSACNAPGADEEPSPDGGPMRITTSHGTHSLEDGWPAVAMYLQCLTKPLKVAIRESGTTIGRSLRPR